MFNKFTKNNSIEYLIVGLGNPGSQYDNTRHNAGFLCIDYVAQKLGTKIDRLKYEAMTCQVQIGEKKCLLMKPQTYMNLSGKSVSAAAKFYKIPPENIVIIFDDISLSPGRMRIRRNGSAGGHNGIKSLISELGSDKFPRIKLGVGEKPHKDYDLADWVLGKFTKEERENLEKVFDNALGSVDLIINNQIDKAMGKYNN